MEMQTTGELGRSGNYGTGKAQDQNQKAHQAGHVDSEVSAGSQGFAKKQKRASARQLLRLLRNQGKVCALSGRPITKRTAELDHKIPWSESHDDSVTNLQWIDAKVNGAKGAMSSEAFIAMCREVVAYRDQAGPSRPN